MISNRVGWKISKGTSATCWAACSRARKKKRVMKVPDAQKHLTQEEAQKLIDMDEVVREAITKVEQTGSFLDEIDKIAGRERAMGPDVP